MTEDRARSAFRTGLRPFVEGAPRGPAFDDLAAAALEKLSPEPGLRTLLAGILALVIVGGGALVLLQPRDSDLFDVASAAELGERFWSAVSAGDAAGIAETTHPGAELNLEGLAELAGSRGTPLEIRLDRNVFGQDGSPQLCYLLDGPNGEARGSIVFREDAGRWLVDEVHTGTAACVISSPTTTEPMAFDLESFMPQLRGRFQEADQVAFVILSPFDRSSEIEGLIGALPEVYSSEMLPGEDVTSAAGEWARVRLTGSLLGEWSAFGLVPLYRDSPVDEWMTRLSTVSGIHVAKFGVEVPRVRIPEGWFKQVELPFQYGTLGVSNVATDRGIVTITVDNETLFVEYDGGWRLGDPVPQRVPSVPMLDAYEAAVGDLVVYLSQITFVLDVESLTWSEVPLRPVGRVLGSAVIGDELYVVGSGSEPQLAVFDPQEMSWRSLDPVPAFVNVGDVTTDGTNLYVAGVRQGSRNEVIGDRNPVVFRYGPGVGWTELPSIPIDGQAPGIGWADGLGLIGWNYDHEAALFTGGTWQALPDHPSACESYPRAETIPGGMYGFLCEPLIFDSSTMQWTAIEAPGWPTLLGSDGTALYVLTPNIDTTLVLRYDLD